MSQISIQAFFRRGASSKVMRIVENFFRTALVKVQQQADHAYGQVYR